MKVAILGAGFIGMNYIKRALKSDDIVNVLDHKVCPIELEGKLNWIRGDLDDNNAVHNVLGDVEVVFHFISNTIPEYTANHSAVFTSNICQTLNLLNLCLQHKVRRIVFISSASVYGLSSSLPISEIAPTEPISSYGIQKLTIEKYLKLYHYQHGIECKIMRLSNPYGPGQNIQGSQGFIAILIGKILSGEPVNVRGDGCAIRDYIYIDDVTEALWRFGNCISTEDVLNFGSGKGYTLNEILYSASHLIGQPIKVNYTDARFVDIPASILDISLASKILGITNSTALEIGLAKTLSHHGFNVKV